jgi:hypothetical protein
MTRDIIPATAMARYIVGGTFRPGNPSFREAIKTNGMNIKCNSKKLRRLCEAATTAEFIGLARKLGLFTHKKTRGSAIAAAISEAIKDEQQDLARVELNHTPVVAEFECPRCNAPLSPVLQSTGFKNPNGGESAYPTAGPCKICD